MLIIISNPASGDGTGLQFVKQHVIPLIQHMGKYIEFETTGPGAAEQYAQQIVQQHVNSEEPIDLIISGGDGTVHEIINGIGKTSCVIRLILCPLGTANALYSTHFPVDPTLSETEYRLLGVRAYLKNNFKPLIITETCLYTENHECVKSVLGVVVTSTALHAAILHSAERLRATIKSLERFKLAAMENITLWYKANLMLLSHNDVHPTVYDPNTDRFTALSDDILTGPFAYFISTTNVDRLEPAFQISPLFSRSPPLLAELDLVLVRPLRDPEVRADDEVSRTNFSSKLMNVLQSAYQQGAHVNMRYTETDASVNSDFIVEYIRATAWKWIPVIAFCAFISRDV
ncbi:hypothetical protein Clacol_006693 [Clathrus columnatus]|uniref:DAGKc domain-containing protein n=1 Tax=Clathrus columnatus TaxID=1419009 RepID=A0AAV5ACS9_9AGAM|nr:hypothetical protein Clacol_006693 [Clathrus columnatus]